MLTMNKISEVLQVETFRNNGTIKVQYDFGKAVLIMLEAWTNELTPSMLPDGVCRAIAEEIGADNLLKLSILIGGSTFYLPKKEAILRPLRDLKVCEEYNGYNTVELSKKYDITEGRVRQIINRDTVNSVSKEKDI